MALENIRILQEEKIVETSARPTPGRTWRKRWKELGEHPLVGEARIAGMVGALELVPNKPSRAYLQDRGTVGAAVPRLSP